MTALFITLGVVAYIGAIVSALKTKDWKPRLFLNFYSDLFLLTASILAKSSIFTAVFAISIAFSVLKIIAYSKATIQYIKKEKEENPME